MKKTIVALACCALFASLAFAQTKRQTTTTTETITVTGRIVTESEEGSAANYQPARTLVIREDTSNKAGRYVLNGRGNVVDKRGATVKTAVKRRTPIPAHFPYTTLCRSPPRPG